MVNKKTDPSEKKTTEEPHLRRILGLWDLIIYGIVLIQPIAAIGLFGIASKGSRGHMVLTLLIAMVAMMLTAISYGRMASLFPSAGQKDPVYGARAHSGNFVFAGVSPADSDT